MKPYRQALGSWGESLAADYLAKRGFTILERNTHTPYGEIDLVARKDDVIVFVEVKTRSSSAYGLPEDSVNARKQAHLLAATEHYMQQHPDLECNWRVDIIAIQRSRGHSPQITHFENAIH